MTKSNVYKEVEATCSCGEKFATMSTSNIHVEVCSKCHPFYTGTQTRVSKAGRVEKFNQKYGLKG